MKDKMSAPKNPLAEAAERIEARLIATGYKVVPREPSPTNQLQATFIPAVPVALKIQRTEKINSGNVRLPVGEKFPTSRGAFSD